MTSLMNETSGTRPVIGRNFGIITLVIAMVAMGVAGWGRVAAKDDIVPQSSASLSQLTPGSEPSLTVTGYGEATAPADSALVQLLIGRVQSDFGMGMPVPAMGGDVAVAEGAVQGEVAGATPGADEPMMPESPELGVPLEEAELEPILAALDAAGIAPESVEVVISPIPPDPYAGPYGGGARLEFSVQSPDLAGMNDLVTTVSLTASENGLTLVQAGASYRLDDCTALEDEAQVAAIEDARQRAERLAEQLGVTTGETLLASDFGFYGDPGLDACSPFDVGAIYAEYGGPGSLSLTVPTFDPSRPAEVTVMKQLYLGVAIT